MPRALAAVLLLLLGCDDGGRREQQSLREELAAQQARVDALERRLEQLEVEHARVQAAALASPPAVPTPTPPAADEAADPADAPYAEDCPGGRCVVKRADLDALLADQAKLMRSARFVPVLRDGASVGFKLFGIRPDSELGSFGLRNGDLVRSIDEFPLADADQALKAYAGLRTRDTFEILVERRGAPLKIRVEVR